VRSAELTYWAGVDVVCNHIPELWSDVTLRRTTKVMMGMMAVGAVAGIAYYRYQTNGYDQDIK